MTTTQPKPNYGIVKQVLSGDSVIIRGKPMGGPPKERQLILSLIIAPKLGRRPTNNKTEAPEEPYAWEAREYLRKKIIGQDVVFTVEKPPNSNREYGTIYLGKDIEKGENVIESLVSEGLVSVRREGVRSTPEHQRLCELEDKAKAEKKGKWSTSSQEDHVRDVKWNIDNPRQFLEKYGGKPIKAIIEHVRDGSTVRAFLLPDFYHVTLMISGIRCPGFKLDAEGKPDTSHKVEYAEEAKFLVESMILQRDVEIILESSNNNYLVGSIIHPKGNIAEVLLRQGFAKCVDWSMAHMKSGAEKLRAAEKLAKEQRLRLWKDYQAGPQVSGKEFSGIVTEIVNADALVLKLADGTYKKIFLASIRPPRDQKTAEDKSGDTKPAKQKIFRALYDIPFMFEAREFLRKKLIGKKVNVVVDYIQEKKDNFPEKVCCTVTISGMNIAEAIVSKGLATVVRYRQDDDQRSSHYDELLAAEMRAMKAGNNLHSKTEHIPARINDLCGDHSTAKKHMTSLLKKRQEAIVEFVASGSRLRLYAPKANAILTFLLAGINCPRGSRPGPGNTIMEGEPYGEEALQFTKDKCLQRDVSIFAESCDKAGNFIGWLWIDKTNLSVALVQEGLASVHHSLSTEKSDYYSALKSAEESAKDKKEKIWKNYVEENEEEKKVEEDKIIERKIDYQKVYVIETTNELHIYVQFSEQGDELTQLMAKFRQEFAANPPLPGAYIPKRGDICAAKFSEDGNWYRAKIERVSGSKVSVFYIDYGNREDISVTSCAALPSSYTAEKPFAHEYGLACVHLPKNDNEYREEAIAIFKSDVQNYELLMNVEYKINNLAYVTLVNPNNDDQDVAKTLISEGYFLVENRREKRLQKLVEEYKAAEESAKKSHLNVWRYGDITEDECKEFGLPR